MVFEHCNKNRTIFERKTSVYFKLFNGIPFEYLEYVMLNSVRSIVKFLPNEVLNIFKR